MRDRRRAPTAEERLAELLRERRRLERERMIRSVAGERWQRLVHVVPALFLNEGDLLVRRMVAPADDVIAALRDDAVFALDTAMRLSRGYGFLRGGDVHTYLLTKRPVDRITERGLLDPAEERDWTLSRPWGGRPRLFAAVVESWPPLVQLASGHRVVDAARLRRELVGAVGQRPDLFALAE